MDDLPAMTRCWYRFSTRVVGRVAGTGTTASPIIVTATGPAVVVERMGTAESNFRLPSAKEKKMAQNKPYVRWFDELCLGDVAIVGGKNASLGEMICALRHEEIRVPDGFATTADAFHEFLEANGLMTHIRAALKDLERGNRSLDQAGRAIRRLFEQAHFPDAISEAICQAYRELSRRYQMSEADVAVRSSATAEDLPEASFAGQQETFLNVTGEEELLEACRNCYA